MLGLGRTGQGWSAVGLGCAIKRENRMKREGKFNDLRNKEERIKDPVDPGLESQDI